jgi:hypothetical protein
VKKQILRLRRVITRPEERRSNWQEQMKDLLFDIGSEIDDLYDMAKSISVVRYASVVCCEFC